MQEGGMVKVFLNVSDSNFTEHQVVNHYLACARNRASSFSQ